MRYVIETECERCEGRGTDGFDRNGSHAEGRYVEWQCDACDGAGGSRRVVTPTQPDYEAAWEKYYVAADRRHKAGLTDLQLRSVVDAALSGLVVIEGEPE